MATIVLPDSFQRSCLESKLYPQNLIHESPQTFPTALESYKKRLDALGPRLFIESEDEVDISFRDLHNASGKGERRR